MMNKPVEESMLSALKTWHNMIYNEPLQLMIEDAIKVIKSWLSLDDLRKEYEEQDNRITAYPIYVTVQEKVCVGVMDEDYGLCVDGETRTEYKHADLEAHYLNEDDLYNDLKEYYGSEPDADDYLSNEMSKVEALQVGYIWKDVEVFLTIKGAEKYIISNSHHLKEPRTYIKHFSTRNVEMHTLLETIGFKTNG